MLAFGPVEATARGFIGNRVDRANVNSKRLEPCETAGRQAVRPGSCAPKQPVRLKPIGYLDPEPTGEMRVASARIGKVSGYRFTVRRICTPGPRRPCQYQ